MKKLEVISYLKGVSIFTIVIMHLIQIYLSSSNIVNKIVSVGGSGVHIFIICSGFGLYYSHINKPLKYTEFFKKRLLKVYIPYILVIFLSSMIPFMYMNSDKLTAILSHVFLFKMFVEKYECSFGVQFWFISTIIQFYLVFNILVKIKDKFKSNRFFFLFSILISFSWWIAISILEKSDVRVWNSFFLQYLWEFSLGMILAEIYNRNNTFLELSKLKLLLGSIIGLGITAITIIIGGIFKNFNDISSVAGYGFLALFVYRLNNKIINEFFVKISKISYEWYLLHILVFNIVFYLFSTSSRKYFVGIIAFILSLIISKVYYMLLNKCKLLKSIKKI